MRTARKVEPEVDLGCFVLMYPPVARKLRRCKLFQLDTNKPCLKCRDEMQILKNYYWKEIR